jgi:hypothetical protein
MRFTGNPRFMLDFSFPLNSKQGGDCGRFSYTRLRLIKETCTFRPARRQSPSAFLYFCKQSECAKGQVATKRSEPLKVLAALGCQELFVHGIIREKHF